MPETLVSVRPSPVHAVRWAAVLAGMAVGIALHLVLALAGAALGLALYGPPESLSVAAAVWNALSMLIVALIGAYVAARASGLRRLADGVLHGIVWWGGTTLLFAALATTGMGGRFGGLFGLVAPQPRIAIGPAASQSNPAAVPPLVGLVIEGLRSGDRATAVRQLQEQGQLTEEEATRYFDLGAVLFERAPSAAAATVKQPAAVAAAANGWLAGAIVLSLIAGMIGGGIGARGARRLLLGGRAPTAADVTRPGLAKPPRLTPERSDEKSRRPRVPVS